MDRNRLFLVEQSLTLIARHPLGIGWGGFASTPTAEAAYFGRFAYPHNILLEVLVEGGWLAGLMLIGLVIWSVRGFLLTSDGPQGAALYALGTYWFLVAQTSGDLNGNRMTWVTLLLGVVLHSQASRGPAGPVPITGSDTRPLLHATTMSPRLTPGVGKTGN